MKLHPIKSIAARLSKDDMELLGIDRTMRLAKKFNRLRYGRSHRQREKCYRRQFEQLLAEHGNGSQGRLAGKMEDGWLLDPSHSLPYLDQLITDAEVVIAERGGRPPTPTGKPFIVDIAKHADLDRFDSFLNFALSAPMLRIVSDYLGFVPVLSTTMPPGAIWPCWMAGPATPNSEFPTIVRPAVNAITAVGAQKMTVKTKIVLRMALLPLGKLM